MVWRTPPQFFNLRIKTMTQEVPGSYLREADNAHFTYVVSVDSTGFSARVYDANGDLAGTPSIAIYPSLEPISKQAKKWVEECIRDLVAVR